MTGMIITLACLLTDISLIIPTCGRRAELRNCLAALIACLAEVKSSRCQIVVSFDDDSAWMEETPPGRVEILRVRGPGRGPAANRNAGAAKASGEWLIFMDDDCTPDQQFLSAYLNFIRAHPGIRAMEGRTYPERPADSLVDIGPFNEQGGCFYSCNIAMRRDLFEELGGFDEDYAFSLEDMDLYTRLLKRNEPIAFVPAASVMHPQKQGLGWKFFWSMHRGRLTYMTKHPDRTGSYSCEKMWKIWLHGLLFTLPRDVVRWRGRGLGTRLIYEALSFFEPLLLKFDAMRLTRNLPSRQIATSL